MAGLWIPPFFPLNPVQICSGDNFRGIYLYPALQDGLGTAGISVRLDGVLIGRFLSHGNPGVDVNVAPSAGTGIVEVAEAVGVVNTDRIGVISPTGYVFGIATSDFDNPSRLSEGELGFAPIFFDAASCMGNRFFPVEGPTGFFSTFELGSGILRPVKRWAFRQGTVFASPDPTDPNPVYMIRRGQNAQTVPLQSVLLWFTATEQLVCVEVMNFPGFDISLPDPFDNSAFAVEPVDAVETGVAGTLGGAITIGF